MSIKERISKLNKKVLVVGVIFASCIWLLCLIGLIFGLGDDPRSDFIGFLIIWPVLYFIFVMLSTLFNQLLESDASKSIFGDSRKIIFIFVQIIILCGFPLGILKEMVVVIITK